MKNLSHLVPANHTFIIDEQNPFLITQDDLHHVSRVGVLVYALLKAIMMGIKHGQGGEILRYLADGLDAPYQTISAIHPDKFPALIRVDLMVDTAGQWRIAEIDPANKHGLGFGLATRYESGAGDRQKLLTLLAPHVTAPLTIVLGHKETFFRFEQRFLAKKLAAHTGQTVSVLSEEQYLKKTRRGETGLILDFPFCGNAEAREALSQQFQSHPETFINPPRHPLGGKAVMTLPFEQAAWLEATGLPRAEIQELKDYLPPTYNGPFVRKEVFSSGAKGVSFIGIEGSRAVFQQYVPQSRFKLGGKSQYIRLACYFVEGALGELVVTANTELPVHGGATATNYHVNLKTT